MSRQPTQAQKTAAVLLMLKRGTDWLIPEPIRSKGSAKEICAAVQWHHEAEWAITRETRPQLLTPLRKPDHEHITKTVSIPRIVKARKIAKAQQRFTEAMAAKARGEKPTRKTKSRPIPGSRNTRFKRKINGKTELRT